MKKNLSLIAGVAGVLAGVSVVCSQGAMAATQAVTANIAFDTAIALVKNADIDFGTVAALTAGTYTINTAAAVTPGGGGVWLFGTPAAGNIKINGSTTQAIDISAAGYTANSGVTPSAATCSYDGAAAVACTDASMTGAAAPGGGAGKILLLGVLATVDGSQAAASSATPSFTVTVVYN